MEIFPGITIEGGLSLVVGVMIKILMVILLLLSLLLVKQDELMSRVVNVEVGRGLKLFVWGYFLVVLGLTAIVVMLA